MKAGAEKACKFHRPGKRALFGLWPTLFKRMHRHFLFYSSPLFFSNAVQLYISVGRHASVQGEVHRRPPGVPEACKPSDAATHGPSRRFAGMKPNNGSDQGRCHTSELCGAVPQPESRLLNSPEPCGSVFHNLIDTFLSRDAEHLSKSAASFLFPPLAKIPPSRTERWNLALTQ